MARRQRIVTPEVRFRWHKGKYRPLPDPSETMAKAIVEAMKEYPMTIDEIAFPFQQWNESPFDGRPPDRFGHYVFTFNPEGEFMGQEQRYDD